MRRRMIAATLAAAALLHGGTGVAEVVDASDTHFRLRHEAVSTQAPDALWARLIVPAQWWSPDHTYSGDAGNLSLDARAGGEWREDWSTGSVVHGQVVYFEEGKTLRLEAPFGPLQAMGASVTWSISLEPAGEGSRVVFDEIATAAPGSNMAMIAPAVDGVKAEALRRLVGGE